MSDEQLAKPIAERWSHLHAEAVTDLTKWPTERGPENLFYQVKQLIEELGAAESRVRELEQALRTAADYLRGEVPDMDDDTTPQQLIGIVHDQIEASLHVADKAVKS